MEIGYGDTYVERNVRLLLLEKSGMPVEVPGLCLVCLDVVYMQMSLRPMIGAK